MSRRWIAIAPGAVLAAGAVPWLRPPARVASFGGPIQESVGGRSAGRAAAEP